MFRKLVALLEAELNLRIYRALSNLPQRKRVRLLAMPCHCSTGEGLASRASALGGDRGKKSEVNVVRLSNLFGVE